jgi:SAM-dependent methyltransferase
MLPLQFTQQLANSNTFHPSTPSLLRACGESKKQLDFDQFQRYSHVATLLDRMLCSFAGPIRILEVGCNVLDLLPHFLDTRRVQVIGCDVERFRSDPNFVLIQRDQPLPFASGSFDAVVALEVLEHIAIRDRPSFLADCLRVARHGAIFSCPNGVSQVIEAERWAAAAYRDRHDAPHPYLVEHAEFGLPRETEIRDQLSTLECSFTVFDNAPLDDWLSMMVLSETLCESAAPDEIHAQVQRILEGLPRQAVVPYRKIYVCAKSFDATRALEPVPIAEAKSSHEMEIPGAFSRLAELATSALMENARTRQQMLVAHEDKNALLEERTQKKDAALEESRQRQIILHSLLTTLTSSRKWRLSAPLRAARQLLRPRRLDIGALIPVKQLVATENAK